MAVSALSSVPDPSVLFRDACRTAIADCQAAVPTFQDAIDNPTAETIDAARVLARDLLGAFESVDSAGEMMEESDA